MNSSERLTSPGLHAVRGLRLHVVRGLRLHVVRGLRLHALRGLRLHVVRGLRLHVVRGLRLHVVRGLRLHVTPINSGAYARLCFQCLMGVKPVGVCYYLSFLSVPAPA